MRASPLQMHLIEGSTDGYASVLMLSANGGIYRSLSQEQPASHHIVLTLRGPSVCLSVSLFVCVCICLLVTTVSREKTAEPIEMPFGGRDRLAGALGTAYQTGYIIISATWPIRLNRRCGLSLQCCSSRTLTDVRRKIPGIRIQFVSLV